MWTSIISGAVSLGAKGMDLWDSLWKAEQDPKVVTGAEAAQEVQLEEKLKADLLAAKKGDPDAFRADVAD